MIKRIVLYAITTVVTFFIAYYLNSYLVKDISFSLFNVYFFQIAVTIIVYAITEFLLIKFPNETGYFFLGLTMLQFGIFAFFFKEDFFSDKILSKPEKFSIITPLFLSLIIEVSAVVKLLNQQEFNR